MIHPEVLNRIFKRMAATYGAAWDRSIGSAPIDDIREIWAHELAGFASKLGDIAWGLENLPEKCPNVLEFRALCRRAPAPELKQLQSPPANPERMKAAMTELRGALGQSIQRDPKQWAHDIVSDLKAGKKVPAYRIEAARIALGVKGRQPWQ